MHSKSPSKLSHSIFSKYLPLLAGFTDARSAAQRTKFVKKVHKPPLRVNVIYSEQNESLRYQKVVFKLELVS